MLHIISKSVFENAFVSSGLRVVADDDVVLLLGDGVYSANHECLQGHKQLYAIEEDRAARGLPPVETVRYIDYGQMVTLTEQNSPVLTWR